MSLSNKPFIAFETSLSAWLISHAVVNDYLQTISLVVSIAAGVIGIYVALFKPEKLKRKK